MARSLKQNKRTPINWGESLAEIDSYTVPGIGTGHCCQVGASGWAWGLNTSRKVGVDSLVLLGPSGAVWRQAFRRFGGCGLEFFYLAFIFIPVLVAGVGAFVVFFVFVLLPFCLAAALLVLVLAGWLFPAFMALLLRAFGWPFLLSAFGLYKIAFSSLIFGMGFVARGVP